MTSSIQEKIKAYYTKYYRDECCLKKWEKCVEARLHEEESEFQKMEKLEQILGVSFEGQKHCIIGAGTGGLVVILKEKFNVDVYGVEPSDEEFEIIKERALNLNIPEDHFVKVGGEKVPYQDNFFDVVHCFTVLEHVQDVNLCLDEMIRIVKPTGKVYIVTPNYTHPYERHYKIPFPTFLPKIFGTLYLLLLRKSPAFLKTINYITEKSINKMLVRKQNILWYRVYRSHTGNTGHFAKFFDYLLFSRFIYPTQEIIISKINSVQSEK